MFIFYFFFKSFSLHLRPYPRFFLNPFASSSFPFSLCLPFPLSLHPSFPSFPCTERWRTSAHNDDNDWSNHAKRRKIFLSLFLFLICNFCLIFILLFISFIVQNRMFILPPKSTDVRKK